MANIKLARQSAKDPLLDTIRTNCVELDSEKEKKHSPLTDKTLLKTVKVKAFQNHIIPNLIRLAEEEDSEYWQKRLWKVFYCSDTVNVSEGVPYRFRCKYKECLICQRHTTHQRLRTHLPIIKTWEDPVFLTLTIPNVPYWKLRSSLHLFGGAFREITQRARNRNIPLRGTRNIEITYSITRGDFHPHLHCIIEGRKTAEFIIETWQELFPEISLDAQNIRSFGGNEKDILEAFKYANKIISGKDRSKQISTWAVHEMNKALQGGSGGVRTFQTFGYKAKELELTDMDIRAIDKEEAIVPDGSYKFVFDKEAGFFDYIDPATGYMVTNYTMGKGLREFLNTKIK